MNYWPTVIVAIPDMISVLSPLNLPQFPARSLPYFPGRVTHQFLQSPHRLRNRFSLLSLQSLCFEACFLLEQCRFVAIYCTNGGSVPNSAHSGTVPNYWSVITRRLLNCLAIVQYRFPVCNSTIGRIVLQSIDAVEIRIPAAEFNSCPLYNVQPASITGSRSVAKFKLSQFRLFVQLSDLCGQVVTTMC